MRFRLRTLLIAVGIACLSLGVAADRGYRQKLAVDAIRAGGGRVDYPEAGAWSRPCQAWLGPDFCLPVSQVYWAGAAIDDDDLACLRTLPRVETISLASTPITDAGLAHLEGLEGAKLIDLRFTQVTDEGANRLRRTLPYAKILLHSDVD